MAKRRKSGRAINGVVLLDKPLGESSNRYLQRVRAIFNAQKAGHTGALDPLASGMLPICLGEATKFSQFLLDSDKQYEVTAKLGVRTTTSDADGEVVETRPVNVDAQQINDACLSFQGDIMQVPSIYSALKHEGKPYYWYARQGIDIERPARPITLYCVDVVSITQDTFSLKVHCSKGTYIRSLIDDIGQLLGCGAYVTRLHRTAVADYPATKMVSFDTLQALADEHGNDRFSYLDEYLLPHDSPVARLPACTLTQAQQDAIMHGQPVDFDFGSDDVDAIRIYGPQSVFLGVVRYVAGRLLPIRLITL